jgi:carbon-monoxide dehydrogenase medium subunit
MPELKALLRPQSLEEALEMLSEHGSRARPLAGGTSVILSRPKGVDLLVDLRRTGLDTITTGPDKISVGAMVTCAQLSRAGRTLRLPRVLVEAAGLVGSRVLQNHVTVGGNCVAVFAWSDLPVALLSIGAEMVIRSPEGERRLSTDEFFAAHPARVLNKGELLARIDLPVPVEGTGSAYLKFSRNAGDQALASVAARVAVLDGKVQRARLVAGAVRGSPQVLDGSAAQLKDRAPDPPLFSVVGEAAAQEAKVSSDFKASAEYRRALVASLVEDAVTLAVLRAGGAP